MVYSGITDIEISDNLGVTPARTNRETGKVWINRQKLGLYPKEIWKYILAHEDGHITLQTTSEIQSDEYASQKFLAAHPDKPFMTVDALQKVLPMNTKEQFERVELQRKRAAKFDCAKNKTASSCAMVGINANNNFTGSGRGTPQTGLGYAEVTVIDFPKPNNTIKMLGHVGSGCENVICESLQRRGINTPTGADFLRSLKEIKTRITGQQFSNFLEGNCKKGEYACIAAETKRDAAEKELAAQQLLSDTLTYANQLDYMKAMQTLNALQQSDKSKTDLAKLEYDLELKRIAADASKTLDGKKLGMVVMLMAAALLAIYLINSDEK